MYRHRKGDFKKKIRLSATRRKNKGENIRAWRERLKESILPEKEQENINQEIEIQKKCVKRLSSDLRRDICDKPQPVQAFPSERNVDEFILPDTSDFENNDANNELITDIKVEPCEEDIEEKFQVNSSATSSSSQHLNNFGKNCDCSDLLCLSSNNVTSSLSLADVEILYEVIKYLDDHANEDMFNAAEKYYAFKLSSASRSQQLLAKKLMNKVLAEAKKGNLNVSVLNFFQIRQNQILPDSSLESDIQIHFVQNRSSNVCADDEQIEDDMQASERGYLCPLRNKIINKMKESLLKSIKQDRSVNSYANQLRSLSNVQYFFADKLINEILSEANLGRLKHSSGIGFLIVRKKPKRKPLKKSEASACKKTEHPNRPKLDESYNKTSLTLDNSSHPLKVSESSQNLKNSSSPTHKLSSVTTPTQTAKQNSDLVFNTVQDSSLSAQKVSFISTPIPKLEQDSSVFFNAVQETSLPTQNTSFISTPTQTLQPNFGIFLNAVQGSSLATQEAYFISTPTQTLSQNSPVSVTLPFINSINPASVIPSLNQSNSAAVSKLTHSVPVLQPIVSPTQVYYYPIVPPVSSALN